VAEVLRRLLAGDRHDPANLLRRERRGTAGTRPVGQQGADRFAQALGVLPRLVQLRAPCEPALSPHAHGVFAQSQFLGDSLVGAPLADGQHDLGALDQPMRDFAAVGDGLKKLFLFWRQMNRTGRAGHGCGEG